MSRNSCSFYRALSLIPLVSLANLVSADHLDMLGMGILSGDLGSASFDINHRGDMTGYSSGFERGHSHGVYWSKTTGLTRTGELEFSLNSEGRGLNDAGVVVGNSDLWPFVWTRKTGILPIQLPTGRSGGSATDINNNNLIVGFANLTLTTEPIPVVWGMEGLVRNLPLLPGGSQGEARRVNDSDVIVGWSDSLEGRRAAIWSGKVPTSLGLLNNTFASEANGLNELGTVVGSCLSTRGRVPFIWDADKGMRPLPVPAGFVDAWANAVSDNGVVVGAGRLQTGGTFALYWKNGTVQTFNSVAPKMRAAFAIYDAYAINDVDQIAGTWIRAGMRSRGFLGKVVR